LRALRSPGEDPASGEFAARVAAESGVDMAMVEPQVVAAS
jgi:hypothetical protein